MLPVFDGKERENMADDQKSISSVSKLSECNIKLFTVHVHRNCFVDLFTLIILVSIKLRFFMKHFLSCVKFSHLKLNYVICS